MARPRKPSVHVAYPADQYAGQTERIIEYSYSDGTSEAPGGLISFMWIEPKDGGAPYLSVALYRHDAKVRISVSGDHQ